MHGAFTRMLLHQLLDEAQGDRAEAARRVGVGRSTMYRWIEAGLLYQPIESICARYGPRPGSGSKLYPVKALILQRLQAVPPPSGIPPFAGVRPARSPRG